MGKFTKNNFLNTFNKIKEFFRHAKEIREFLSNGLTKESFKELLASKRIN